MRTILIPLAVVLGLALGVTEAEAEAWTLEDYLDQGRTHDWSGFRAGTMIHLRVTREMTDRGRTTPERRVQEERKTLVRITPTEYVFQVASLSAGRWTKTTVREPRVTGLQAVVSEAGNETLTVDGRVYPCRKKRVRWMRGRELAQEAVVWVHTAKGILKMTWTGDLEGETQTTKLDATRRIGATTVRGRETSISIGGPGTPTMKGTRWVSPDVPERLVREEVTGTRQGTTFRVVQEVVAFVRK